jgi:uncharacterized protein YndB with AHSA1/START domain
MATGDPVLEMTRVIDAPRAAVFARWLDPDQLIRWWAAPRPVQATPPRTGRAGEAFRFRVRAPGGGDRWLHVAYREVVAPERLVFTWGGDDSPTVVTVEFAERAGRTTITLRQALETGFPEAERFYQARLDRLAAFLAHA